MAGPSDPPVVEPGPPPRHPEADRLLALGSSRRSEPEPMVQLDRARLGDRSVDLARIEEWARGEERWSTVVEVLSLRARADSGPRRTELYLQAATIAREALSRFDLALQLTEVARGERLIPAVSLALVELYAIAGRPVDAIGEVVRLLQAGHYTRADHPTVAARLAQLAAAKGVDTATRLDTLRRASSLDRASIGLREALVRALDAGRSDWPIQTTVLPPSDHELATELGELALARPLTDPEAVDLLRRSLALRDDPEVHDALLRALAAGRRFGELERDLDARVRRAAGAAKVEALCALADMAARPPWSRVDLARDAYGNALDLDPDCAIAFGWLLDDARSRGDLPRIDRLVTRMLALTFDPARRTAVRHRVLPVWVAAEDWQGVTRTLRGLLVDDPHDSVALEMCEKMLAGEQWANGLVALVASADSPQWARGTEDQRAEVVAACLRVATARGASSAVILPIATRLLRLRPHEPGLAETIANLQTGLGCDERALQTVRQQIESARSDVERGDALCALGQLHRERWEISEAWTAFERALSIDPTHPDALEALGELVREPALEDRTESVLRRRLVSLEAGRTPAHLAHAPIPIRLEVLHQIAGLATDDDEALVLLNRCLELEPDDDAAAEDVTRLLAKKGNSFALAVHLDSRLRRADDAGKVALGKRLARLLGDDLSEPAAAVARWEAVAALAPADDLEAPLALANAYVVAGQSAKAVERWTALVANVPPGPVRTDLLRRIARLTRDPAARAAAYRRVLGGAANDLEALRELCAYYSERREGPFARELALRLAAAATDPAEKARAFVDASTHELPEDAVRTLLRALDVDPASAEALGHLEEAARQLSDWALAIQVLERQLVLATDVQDQIDLAVAAASMWSERLGDDEAAARSLERAQRVDPRSDRILGQLQVLYERSSDWPALARILRARIERFAGTPDEVELLVRLARVHAEHLGEPDVAVALYRQAAEREPRRPGEAPDARYDDLQIDALAAAGAWDKVMARLEARAAAATTSRERAESWSLVCDLASRATGRPSEAFEAARKVAREAGPTPSAITLLVHHARNSGRTLEGVAVLDELASHTADSMAGAHALARSAELLELVLDEPSQALDRHLEILRRVGAGRRTAAEIERLALQEGRVNDWVSAELEREKLATDRAERVAILERTARALDSIQGRPEQAFDLLLRALAIEPQDEALADRVEALATEIDQGGIASTPARARLAETHMRLAEHGVWHLRRALALYESIADPLAFDAAAELAFAAPDDEKIRSALPRLAAPGARWGELLSVYDELAGIVSDPDARLAMRWEQACLLMDRIGRPQPARALLTEVLLERPSRPGLHARALDVARSSGQGREMARALEQRLDAFDRDERIAALRWLADVWAVVLDEPGEVARRCEEVLALDPKDARAAELLPSAYSKTAQWDKLADLLWTRAIGPNGTAEDAAQAADIYMSRLGDPVRAIAAWRRATERSPDQAGWLLSYAAILEHAGDWPELARVLSKLARAVSAPSDRVGVLLRWAKIVAEKLGERDEAIEILEEARTVDPSDIAVLRDLERFYELVGRWNDLAALRSDAAERLQDPADARDVLLRLARGLEAHGNVEGAIDALWRAIAATPEYVPTYGKLRLLLAERGAPEQLIDLLQREAVAWTDPAESADRLCEAAAIVDRDLHDPDRARTLYREAIDTFERCRPAAHALADDAERRGEVYEALSWLENLRRWTVSPDDVAAIDRRMDRLLSRANTRIMNR